MDKLKDRFIKALPKMREAAKKHGYAIAIHGSMERDFDIVVIPWTNDATDTYSVAHAIREAAGSDRWRCPHTRGDGPHGREWWPFDWEDSPRENRGYVDMSIMPRQSI